MTRWDYRRIRQAMESFSGATDPSDPKERKRIRILAAATALFIRHGYRKTSIEEVARQAGVAKGTVYLYYKTKGDLLLQAIVEEKKKYLAQMAPLLDAELPPRERLRQVLRASFMLAEEMPLTSRLLRGDHEVLLALEEASEPVRAQSEDISLHYMFDLIAEATPPGRFSHEGMVERVKVYLGLFFFSGLLGEENVRNGLPVETFIGHLADILVDGVGAA